MKQYLHQIKLDLPDYTNDEATILGARISLAVAYLLRDQNSKVVGPNYAAICNEFTKIKG